METVGIGEKRKAWYTSLPSHDGSLFASNWKRGLYSFPSPSGVFSTFPFCYFFISHYNLRNNVLLPYFSHENKMVLLDKFFPMAKETKKKKGMTVLLDKFLISNSNYR